MSRIGQQPITLPAGVSVDPKGTQVAVKGPNGNLTMGLRPEVSVAVADGTATVERTRWSLVPDSFSTVITSYRPRGS